MQVVDSVEVVENEILINKKEIMPEVKKPRRKDKTASLNKNRSKAFEIYGTDKITREQALQVWLHWFQVYWGIAEADTLDNSRA